jgi:hypothetical protein
MNPLRIARLIRGLIAQMNLALSSGSFNRGGERALYCYYGDVIASLAGTKQVTVFTVRLGGFYFID